THGHDLPEPLSSLIAGAPDARAAVVDLAGETSWWAQLAQRGSLIFADIGFDETGRWDVADLAPLTHCHAFTPNALEAMAYTRTESPHRAVRALAEMVPLAVVTDGAHGSYAIDSSTGEEAYCPAVPVHAIDTTGAGDVFAAAIVLGTLADWPLEERLKFSSLCSALAVQQFGGSLAAPPGGGAPGPAVPVHAIDTTGAGDVFAAAIVLGTLADWPLEERLKFSSLCSALAVQQFGGSLAAPGWGDIMDWWNSLSSAA